MDTKKLILAIVLSVAVLLVYQYFFMPKQAQLPPAPQNRAATQPQKAEAAAETKAAAPDIGSILGQDEPAAVQES
jgi:YidC/Oxa1 family membrane protein insertase